MKKIIEISAIAILLISIPSCETTKKVLWIRIDCSDLTISCLDEFELTFRPAGTTQFRGSSIGTWAEGDISYKTEEREGINIFIVVASGNWIREEVMNNREKFPGQFVFEIPLKNIESSGTFDLRGYWKYREVTTGIARHPTGEVLTTPDPDSIFSITVFRQTNDLCLSNPPDSETSPEVVDDTDLPGDIYEDIEIFEEMETIDDEQEGADIDEE